MNAGDSSSGYVKGGEKSRWALPPPSTIIYHFGTSGVAVAAATAVTHPLDVVKVRLQMQLVGQRGPLIGMGRTFTQMLRNEGGRSLYLGLTPALTRSVLYGGLRLGLYEPSKYVCELAFGSTNILLKIAAGGFAGSFATALTNPIEVLKVRLQMNSGTKVGAISEMCKIAKEEGVSALWKGVGPAMARAACLTASQLATYDESKRVLTRLTPLEEGFSLHFISSTIAGVVSTLITAPMDMVKTRLMLQRESSCSKNYKNGFNCAYKLVPTFIMPSLSHGVEGISIKALIFEEVPRTYLFHRFPQVMRTEGPRALYKGGFTIFARLGPQTTITFVLCEKLRELTGLHAI